MKVTKTVFCVWHLLYFIITILSFIIMSNWGIIFGALFFGVGVYTISKAAYYILYSKDNKKESKQ